MQILNDRRYDPLERRGVEEELERQRLAGFGARERPVLNLPTRFAEELARGAKVFAQVARTVGDGQSERFGEEFGGELVAVGL